MKEEDLERIIREYVGDVPKDPFREVVNLCFLYFKREQERQRAENDPDENPVPFLGRFERANFVILTFIYRGSHADDMTGFVEQLSRVTMADVIRFYETDPEFGELQRKYNSLRADHQKILASYTNIPPGEFSEWRLKSVYPHDYPSLLKRLDEANSATAPS